jgi:Arc/MetJ-type ribon-helix-helix transcriptional regulator
MTNSKIKQVNKMSERYEPYGVSMTPEMNHEIETAIHQEDGRFLNKSHLIREGIKMILKEIKTKEHAEHSSRKAKQTGVLQ